MMLLLKMNASETSIDFEATVDEVEKTTKANDDFACELSDSRFKNFTALRTHEGHAHKAYTGSPISQLDGHSGKLEATITINDNEN